MQIENNFSVDVFAMKIIFQKFKKYKELYFNMNLKEKNWNGPLNLTEKKVGNKFFIEGMYLKISFLVYVFCKVLHNL